MKIVDIYKFKINFNIAIWIFIICILFLLNQKARNFQLKSDISKLRKNQKNEIQENIKSNSKKIQQLQSEKKIYKMQIQDLILEIDSIHRIKSKIKIKYVNRVSNIKIMDSEEIKNYWNEEFN